MNLPERRIYISPIGQSVQSNHHRKFTDMIKQILLSIRKYYFPLSVAAFLIVVNMLLCTTSTGYAYMLDRSVPENHPPEITILGTNYTGHTPFAAHSGSRTYTFDIDFRVGTTHLGTQCSATWNRIGSSLSVSCPNYGSGTFNCGQYDPFLAPEEGKKCTLSNIKLTKKYENYADAIANTLKTYFANKWFTDIKASMNTNRLRQMQLDILAKDMTPCVLEKGQTCTWNLAQSLGPAETKAFKTKVNFQAAFPPDVKIPANPVISYVIAPDEGQQVMDINGNILAMPLTTTVDGTSHHGATRTLQRLMPGKYTFYAEMMTSLTTSVASNKVAFEVKSDIDPHKAPIVLLPLENGSFAPMEPVPIKIQVSSPMFNTGFGAEVEVEHSRLATQTPYKPYEKFSMPASGKNSILKQQRVFEDSDSSGDLRLRARMLYHGKSTGEWSEWRHFHIGEKKRNMPHKAFRFIAPLNNQTFTRTVPVRIALPKTMKGAHKLVLTWIKKGLVSRILKQDKIDVHPAINDEYNTSEAVSELLSLAGNNAGKIKLRAAITGSSYEDTVVFNIPQLGEAAHWGDEKKDTSFSLDTPVFIRPQENQIFMAPAQVQVEMLHNPEVQVTTEMEYCPFSKDKTAILHYLPLAIKPGQTTKDKGRTTLNYSLKKPGFYRVRASNIDKISNYSPWREFKVDTLNKNQDIQVHDISLAQLQQAAPVTPVILLPHNNSTFTEGQLITLKVKNGKPAKFFHLLIERKPLDGTGTYQLLVKYYRMKKTDKDIVRDLVQQVAAYADADKAFGKFRVKVGFSFTGTNSDEKTSWSKWVYFKRLPKISDNLNKIRHHHNIIPPVTSTSSTNRAINPQPEPPGKQLRSIIIPLLVQIDGHSFRAPAKVRVQLHNAPYSRLPFELRYRPHNGSTYTTLRKPSHQFSRIGKLTTLTLELNKPGQYQVRFKTSGRGAWGSWTGFTVTKNISHAATLGHRLHMKPAASRMINPQPEPPGRTMQQKAKGSTHAMSTATGNTLRNTSRIKMAPPAITKPRNGQKFMLTGRNLHVKAEISHAPGQKVQLAVERETGSRFVTLTSGIRIHRMKTKTTVDILVADIGKYRLRVKGTDKNGRWGKWTTFTVDRLMKNQPTLHTTRPTVAPTNQQTGSDTSPAMGTGPHLQLVH